MPNTSMENDELGITTRNELTWNTEQDSTKSIPSTQSSISVVSELPQDSAKPPRHQPKNIKPANSNLVINEDEDWLESDDQKSKLKKVKSALSAKGIDHEFIANKVVELLDAKTVNPITGQEMEDNVTQRNILKLVVSDLLHLNKQAQQPQPQAPMYPPVVQVFNTNPEERKWFR